MRTRPAAPAEKPRVYYRRPLLDRPLGRSTAEWEGPDGKVELQALTRVQDWEGNWPSLYSVLRLPYVLLTYIQVKRSPILPRPVPFLVLDAVKRLSEILRSGMKVLEIGGGNSTLWFLEKGAHVTTFDHSGEWVNSIEQAANGNDRLQITVAKGQQAVSLIDELPDQAFDIALVDSTTNIPARLCIPSVRRKLRPGGWLVLDNSDYPANWQGVELMADRDRERYVGYSAMALKVCQTSFWRV